jgi:acyl-CoA synthetase (AMP-forming)/AMP-acid ligase II
MSILDKAAGYASVVWNVLPGGKFYFGREQTHLAQPVRVFKTLPAFIGDEYATLFKQHADKEWVVYDGERTTFKAGWKLIQSVARELVEGHGIQQGDKVGIAMRNLPEFCFAFCAIQCAGAVAVPLNSLWKTDELEYAVKDSGCKILIADSERMRRCEPFVGSLGVTTILVRPNDLQGGAQVSATCVWDEVAAAGASRKPLKFPRPVQAEDESMIMYTSGSTGFPKGVVHTQRSLGTMLRLLDLGTVIMPAGNVLLLAVPLFHITAIAGVFLRSIVTGSKLVSMRKWDAGEALNLIEKEKVTGFTGVPTMLSDLITHPEYTKERISTIKSLAAGGAPVPPSQVKAQAEATGGAGGQGYGLTEVIVATTIAGAEYRARPKSCGKPLPLFVEIAIKDPETGKILPVETRGEVCIRSAMVMKGYHNKPDKTAEVMDSEGYFHSGDIGRLDSGGYLYIMDRLKDIIIRGGENIDCSEVEAGLYNHPSVKECSVFGLPDERLGEVIGAAVWCSDDVTPQDIAAKAAETLAKFKVPEPQHIFILKEELPKGATGKIDKKGLRAQFSENTTMKSRL